jgi:hypothetical protein
MISDILSLYQKNIALSRALDSQKSSMGDSDSSGSGIDGDSSKTDFSALLEQAAKQTEKLAAAKRAGDATSVLVSKPSVKTASAQTDSPASTKPARMRDGIDKKSDLYQQCQEFESIFVKQMLDAMRKTVDKSGMTDNGMGQDIFEDMLYDEYAKTMSKTADFGIADTMYRQLSNLRPATSITL